MLFDTAIDETVANLKTSGGRLAGLEISNPNTVSIWIQLFDTLAANVTLGTTVPKMSLAIPKGASAADVGIMEKLWREGVDFSVAISYACTTTADGSTGPTTDLDGNLFYV